jgi:hypothetical protein
MRLISMLALAIATAVITGQASAEDVRVVDLATWTPPSIGSVGDDPFGKLVKYGNALFTDTPFEPIRAKVRELMATPK